VKAGVSKSTEDRYVLKLVMRRGVEADKRSMFINPDRKIAEEFRLAASRRMLFQLQGCHPEWKSTILND